MDNGPEVLLDLVAKRDNNSVCIYMKKSHKTEIMVLIAESHQGRLRDMEKLLRQAGMSRIQCLESIGALTGQIDIQTKEKLSEIPGVAAVEESQAFQLPPPDAEIQ